MLVLIVACDAAPPSDAPSAPAGLPVAPNVTCLGVVATKCLEFLKDAEANGAPVAVTAIRIVCSVPPCTERQGQVKVDVLYGNGQRTSTGTGWATVDGGQVLPPQPIPTVIPPGPSS